jgi:hypothetical protein
VWASKQVLLACLTSSANGLQEGVPDEVPWAEINAALGQAALLLSLIASRAGFQFRQFRYVACELRRIKCSRVVRVVRIPFALRVIQCAKPVSFPLPFRFGPLHPSRVHYSIQPLGSYSKIVHFTGPPTNRSRGKSGTTSANVTTCQLFYNDIFHRRSFNNALMYFLVCVQVRPCFVATA